MVPGKKSQIPPIIGPFAKFSSNRRGTPGGRVGYIRCDRCNAPTHLEVIKLVDDVLYLCPICYQLYQAIPEGCLKRSIRRFLIGNVV